MLKYVSSTECNYDDNILREFNLNENVKLSDFLSTLSLEALNKLFPAEKSETKKIEVSKNKILLLFSIFFRRTVDFSEANKKAVSNVTKLLINLQSNSALSQVDSLCELFQLMTSNVNFQFELIINILEILISSPQNFNLRSENLSEMINSFNNKINKEQTIRLLDSLSQIMTRQADFSSANKLEVNLEILKNEKSIENKIPLLKFLFYKNVNNLVNLTLPQELSNEMKVVGIATGTQPLNILREINSGIDSNYFNLNYGNNFGDKLIVAFKLRAVVALLGNYLETNNTKQVSFSALNSLGLAVEDVEDILFEQTNLAKFSIDYERQVVNVKFFQKRNDENNLKQMKTRIAGLRQKLKHFVEKVDSIITSQ